MLSLEEKTFNTYNIDYEDDCTIVIASGWHISRITVSHCHSTKIPHFDTKHIETLPRYPKLDKIPNAQALIWNIKEILLPLVFILS